MVFELRRKTDPLSAVSSVFGRRHSEAGLENRREIGWVFKSGFFCNHRNAVGSVSQQVAGVFQTLVVNILLEAGAGCLLKDTADIVNGCLQILRR